MKLAVIDLGTNTCRLLLGEVEGGAIVRRDVRETHVVRLGQSVDRYGRLNGEAAARTRRRLADYAARADAYAPERRLLVATSALRDAADGSAFLAAVERDLGLPFRIIGGEEEARLAFRGATAGLDPGGECSRIATASGSAASGPAVSHAAARAVAPAIVEVAVVDIGGGSTEFAIGRPGAAPRFVCSLDVGAVRITERFFAADPPVDAQWHAATAFVDDVLAAGLAEDVRAAPGALVGVSGTFTTLVAWVLGMSTYDPQRVHWRELTLAQIDAAIDLFRVLTSAQRGTLAGIQKGREDVILAGALLARAACLAFGVGAVLVSEDDILEGMALWLADGLPPLA